MNSVYKYRMYGAAERRRSPKNVIDSDYMKELVITKALSTPAGREALAAAMVAPLRKKLYYQSIGRQIFGVQPLP